MGGGGLRVHYKPGVLLLFVSEQQFWGESLLPRKTGGGGGMRMGMTKCGKRLVCMCGGCICG